MDEMTSKTIYIGREAYMFLDRESRRQRGCKPLSEDEERWMWEKITRFGKRNEYQATDDSFGGGDGTYRGKWWGWSVDTLKKMLDENKLPYRDGEEVRYVNL